MRLRYEWDPPSTPGLEDGVSTLWAQVVNAGGAVGFVPPVTADDTRGEVATYVAEVAEGRARRLVGFDGPGEVKATAHLVFNSHRLMRHWVWLYTVMVHPDLQGQGVGRELMDVAERAVRGLDGVRAIRLTCRGGMGLERFYESCGYQEAGRVPGALKVGEDEFRDDVTMWRTLE